MSFFFDAVLSGIEIGLIFALVALGLTIIFGVMDVVNFAHGEFLMVGMYAAYWAHVLAGLDPLTALPIATLTGALLGLVSYYALIQRLLKGPVVAQIFGTFGLMLFIRSMALFFWGPQFRTISQGVLIGKSFKITETIVLDLAKVVPALIGVLAFFAVAWLINRTRVGKALKATALNAEAAGYMGIRASRMYALAWALGGGTAGLAGGLIANFWYVTPTVGLLFVMIAFATVALGGFGSIKGAFYAGLIIGVLETSVGLELPTLKFTAVYAAFFIIVCIRPEGLFGWKH